MQIIAKTIVMFSALALANLLAAASIVEISFVPTSNLVAGSVSPVDITATLTNLDDANPVFLNADNLNLSPFFEVTDDFFTNVPFSLGPGQTSSPITLFTLTPEPGASAGSYTGTYELFGGDGSANQFNFDSLGTASFTVVETAEVPEPASLLLMGSVLVVLASLGRKRKRE
jgi:hypothetical protein